MRISDLRVDETTNEQALEVRTKKGRVEVLVQDTASGTTRWRPARQEVMNDYDREAENEGKAIDRIKQLVPGRFGLVQPTDEELLAADSGFQVA